MIIVVASKSPSSGKTFAALNIATILSDMDISTLLIDGNPNDHLADINDLSESGVIFGKKVMMVMRTLPTGGLKVLSGFGKTLGQPESHEQSIETLEKLRSEFEVIIIDTSSTDENALKACMNLGDLVIVPVQYNRTCISRIPEMLNLCLDTQQHNPEFQFGGFLPCMIDENEKGTQEAQAAELTLKNLSEEFQSLFLCDPIIADQEVLNATKSLEPIMKADEPSCTLQQLCTASMRVYKITQEGSFHEEAPLKLFDSSLEGVTATTTAVSTSQQTRRSGLGALLNWITSFLKK